MFLDSNTVMVSSFWKTNLGIYIASEESLPFTLPHPVWITFEKLPTKPTDNQLDVDFTLSDEAINNQSIPLHQPVEQRITNDNIPKAFRSLCIDSNTEGTRTILSAIAPGSSDSKNFNDLQKQICDIADEVCHNACRKLAHHLGASWSKTTNSADVYVVGQTDINFWESRSKIVDLANESNVDSLCNVTYSRPSIDIDVYEIISTEMSTMTEAIEKVNVELMKKLDYAEEDIINTDVKQTDEIQYNFPVEGEVHFDCGNHSRLTFHFASYDSVMVNKSYAYVESLWNGRPREKDHQAVINWVLGKFQNAHELFRSYPEFQEYEKESHLLFDEPDYDEDDYQY